MQIHPDPDAQHGDIPGSSEPANTDPLGLASGQLADFLSGKTPGDDLELTLPRGVQEAMDVSHDIRFENGAQADDSLIIGNKMYILYRGDKASFLVTHDEDEEHNRQIHLTAYRSYDDMLGSVVAERERVVNDSAKSPKAAVKKLGNAIAHIFQSPKV